MTLPKTGELYQNRYLILSQLGSGGMGLVFHAKQLDADREVALKILRAQGLEDQESVDRFFREFKLLSRLSHPHIMTLYGLSLNEKSQPFAVCEFLDGTSLRSLLQKEKTLGTSRSLQIVLQIADAMQYAHESGVLHRDLKPDNIMLLSQPDPDYVKLVDFGLATVVHGSHDIQKLTITGQLLGTAHYMSPELVNSRADARSDIYSLGCVLFEMLAGEYLFDADNPIGIVYKQCNESTTARLLLISSKVSPDIIRVLEKMLQKKPELRYQSMKELLADLNGLSCGEESVGNASLKNSNPRPAITRYKVQWIAALIALILAVSFLFMYKFGPHSFQFGKTPMQTNRSSRMMLPKNADSVCHMMEREKDMAKGARIAAQWLQDNQDRTTISNIDKIKVLSFLVMKKRGLHQDEDARAIQAQIDSLIEITDVSNENYDNRNKFYLNRQDSCFHGLRQNKSEKERNKHIANMKKTLEQMYENNDATKFGIIAQDIVRALINLNERQTASKIEQKLQASYKVFANSTAAQQTYFQNLGDLQLYSTNPASAGHYYGDALQISHKRTEPSDPLEGVNRGHEVVGRFGPIYNSTVNMNEIFWLPFLPRRLYSFDKKAGAAGFRDAINLQLTTYKLNTAGSRPVAEWVQLSRDAEEMGLPETSVQCLELALNSLQKSGASSKSVSDCRSALAIAYANAGKLEEANKEYDQVFKDMDSNSPAAFRLRCSLASRLAAITHKRNDKKTSDHFIAEAEFARDKLAKSSIGAMSLSELAAMYAARNDLVKSKQLFEEAYKQIPSLAIDEKNSDNADFHAAEFADALLRGGALSLAERLPYDPRILAAPSGMPQIQCLTALGLSSLKSGRFSFAKLKFSEAERLFNSKVLEVVSPTDPLPLNTRLRLYLAECDPKARPDKNQQKLENVSSGNSQKK